MSTTGPKLTIADIIEQKKEELTKSDRNDRRATILFQVLNSMPRETLDPSIFKGNSYDFALILRSLREAGFKDFTQPIIDKIAELESKLKEYNTNSERAVFLWAQLPEFQLPVIQNVLRYEGFTDKKIEKAEINEQSALKYYALMAMTLYFIANAIQRSPGDYARNFTAQLATRTMAGSLNSSISTRLKDYRITAFLLSLSLQVMLFAMMFGYMPSLNAAFKHLPEDLDPKSYADQYVPAVTETFGSNGYYILAALAMITQKYGVSAVTSLYEKVKNKDIPSAAKEFSHLLLSKVSLTPGFDASKQSRPSLENQDKTNTAGLKSSGKVLSI